MKILLRKLFSIVLLTVGVLPVVVSVKVAAADCISSEGEREEQAYCYCFDIWKRKEYLFPVPDYPLLLIENKVKQITIKEYVVDEVAHKERVLSVAVIDLDKDGKIIRFNRQDIFDDRIGGHEVELYTYILDGSGKIEQRDTYQGLMVRSSEKEYWDTVIVEEKNYYYAGEKCIEAKSYSSHKGYASMSYSYNDRNRLCSVVVEYNDDKEKFTLNDSFRVTSWSTAKRYVWGIFTGSYFPISCYHYDNNGVLLYECTNNNELHSIFFANEPPTPTMYFYKYNANSKLMQIDAIPAEATSMSEVCDCTRDVNIQKGDIEYYKCNDKGLPEERVSSRGQPITTYTYEYYD